MWLANPYLDSLVLIVFLGLIVALIIVYQYRHLFSFFQYRATVKPVTEQVDRSRPPRFQVGIVCPRCREVMEEGYLSSPRGIFWNRDAFTLQQHFGWYNLGVNSERLTSILPFGAVATPPSLKAHRCRKCEIIRVDLKSQPHQFY